MAGTDFEKKLPTSGLMRTFIEQCSISAGKAARIFDEAETHPAADSVTAKETSSKLLKDSEAIRLIAEIGTGLWRLHQHLLNTEGEDPSAILRRTRRHVESLWDTLESAGITVQEHTRAVFDSGLRLKAIAFQPTPGLSREMVIETIKPSVYQCDRLIQMGEVLVGIPVVDEQIVDKQGLEEYKKVSAECKK